MLDSFQVETPTNTDAIDREILLGMHRGLGHEDIHVALKAKGLSIGRAELRRIVLGPKITTPAGDRGTSRSGR